MMLALAALLAAIMGLALGLLGGGGSILAVPLLHYVLGLEAHAAIAASLLVVGLTSSVSTAMHARAGRVEWRTGLVFAGVAMVGSFGGGYLAGFLSATTLLLLFAAMMVVAGLAMLRRRRAPAATPDATPRAPRSLWLAAIEGLVVGAITGLVGAGGGFLVVPALVLFGGLDMRRAVGTSAMIVALKSFAGAAGHITHTPLDTGVLTALGLVVGISIVGVLIGARLVERLAPETLRRVFGVMVLVVAALMLVRESPAGLVDAVFVAHWPLWIASVAVATIGLVVQRIVAARRAAARVGADFAADTAPAPGAR